MIVESFSKICRESSSLIKTWQEIRVLYMKTYVHLWQYLAKFFLEWEMFWAKVVEKIKTYILCSITFSPKIVSFRRQFRKISKSQTGHRWQYNTAHAQYMLTKATDTYSGYEILLPFHGNSGYANAPQCYVYTYVACRVVLKIPTSYLPSVFLCFVWISAETAPISLYGTHWCGLFTARYKFSTSV
jgi:hypothetical protein